MKQKRRGNKARLLTRGAAAASNLSSPCALAWKSRA